MVVTVMSPMMARSEPKDKSHAAPPPHARAHRCMATEVDTDQTGPHVPSMSAPATHCRFRDHAGQLAARG